MTDTEIFLKAQQLYNETENEEAYSTMFFKVQKCCDVMIRKVLSKGALLIPDDERDDYSREATFQIMRRYRKNKDYKIRSLPSMCRLALISEVYKKKEKFYRNIENYGANEFDALDYVETHLLYYKENDDEGNI